MYTCKPEFYYIKVGFKGVSYIGLFSWCIRCYYIVVYALKAFILYADSKGPEQSAPAYKKQ